MEKYGFTGWVRNTSDGTQLMLCGEREGLLRAIEELKISPPPLALIESVEYEETEPRFWYNVGGSTFTSRSILLHLEYSPPAEDLDWLELTIGDETLTVSLEGGGAA